MATAAGTTSRATSQAGVAKVICAPGLRRVAIFTNALQQVVLGRHDVEFDAGPGDRTADGLVVIVGQHVQPPAEHGIARVDEQHLPRLGVLHVQQAGIGELVLARVHHPHRNDLVTPGEAQEWSFPIGLADEIGDHDHQ